MCVYGCIKVIIVIDVETNEVGIFLLEKRNNIGFKALCNWLFCATARSLARLDIKSFRDKFIRLE